MITRSPEKITSRHRQLHAYVYVRQSTPKQVQHNRESQRNQYALVQRALELGWPAERIHVIDTDLGHSGQDGQRPASKNWLPLSRCGRLGSFWPMRPVVWPATTPTGIPCLIWPPSWVR
jgi:hypothetical protein